VKIQRVAILWAGLLFLALNSYAVSPVSFTALPAAGHPSLPFFPSALPLRPLDKIRQKPVSISPADVLKGSPDISKQGDLLNLRHDDLVRALIQA